MTDEDAKLIREMHGNIQVLIFTVEECRKELFVQNSSIRSLNKFKIQVQAVFAFTSFVLAIGGGTLIALILGVS